VRATSIIYRRELGAYLKSPMGYIIAACGLFLDGILFYAYAIGPHVLVKGGASRGVRLSGEVLRDFFLYAGGVTMAMAILLSMRLVAQERQSGTLVLLNTSPVRDTEIILGKYLAALTFLASITLLTFYMPAMIMVRGKISMGHILVGYSGMVLLGGATLAIGMFATALAPDQLVAGVIGGSIAAVMYFLYFLAKSLTPPLQGIFEGLSIHHKHYFPFMDGILHLAHVVYYLAVIYFFLLLAIKTMEAKRWR
jgi:ABC-2 type transport system permease protein